MDGSDYDESDEGFDYGVDEDDDEDDDEDVPDIDVLLEGLEDSEADVREEALQILGKLKPATLAQHADAMVARLKNWYPDAIRRRAILETLRALPRFIIRDIDLIPRSGLGPWLLARLAWYRCRLRLRVRRLALYWYALPYRPNGPGHARDVEAWGRILEE